MSDKKTTEESLAFAPKFDQNGLIPCITTCAETGAVLMFAFMNNEALQKTIETGKAHYWSRSRKALWLKGETSGHTQNVVEMRTDCDQDCIWIKVKTAQGACHTGRKGCFYRKIDTSTQMSFIDDEQIFDPSETYKS